MNVVAHHVKMEQLVMIKSTNIHAHVSLDILEQTAKLVSKYFTFPAMLSGYTYFSKNFYRVSEV